MMKEKTNNINSHKRFSAMAQSIIELSLLGAALLSILGILIKVTASATQAQSTQLQAMRQAMKMSAEEALEFEDPQYKGARRKSAQVLWIDDRATIEGGEKYGAKSRTPSIAMGSGTLTNLLEYPMRYYDIFHDGAADNRSPVMDMYINGQHFVFSLGAFKKYGDGENGVYYVGAKAYPYTEIQYFYWNPDICGGPDKRGIGRYDSGRPNCLDDTTFWGSGGPVPDTNDRWWYQKLWTDIPQGLPDNEKQFDFEPNRIPVFWKKIPSTDRNFCIARNDPPKHFCSNVTPEEINERFRYKWNTRKRDGTWSNIDLGENGGIVPASKRPQMSWQWFPVQATLFGDSGWFGGGNADNVMKGIQEVDVDFDGNEESILQMVTVGNHNTDKNTMYTDDCFRWYGIFEEGGKGEQYAQSSTCWSPHSDIACMSKKDGGSDSCTWWEGIWRTENVWVYDRDEGDLNMNYGELDKQKGIPQPGLTQGKAKIYTIDAGELNIDQTANPVINKTKLVSTQKKRTVNIIEREIQLSNNTGRFLAGNTVGNPVDVDCSGVDCCSTPANKYRTCFNRDTLILYVRSLTEDRVGHRFITQTTPTKFP